jgi:Ca-activated chloride channel homolog
MSVQYPWALLLLAIIPAVLYLQKISAGKTGFSQVAALGSGLEPGPVKKYAADALAVLVMSLMVFAIANIQYSSYWQKTFLESRWIMLVQDLSGSMGRPGDEGGRSTLGDVALDGARSFIDMRSGDDLIGIVAFSSFARVIAPPSFDKNILKQKLELLSRRADSFIFRELTVGGATNASYAAWLAVCVFFMLLPEEDQPSYEEINDLRYALVGRTGATLSIPEKLKRIHFGQGMAIVLFTDGRIEANKSEDDAKKGLLNFVNVIALVKQLGIKLYLIVVEGAVTSDIRIALEGPEGEATAGHIFYMPRTFSRQKITEVYNEINAMEKNRFLEKIVKRKRDTRWLLGAVALCVLCIYCFLQLNPYYRKI